MNEVFDYIIYCDGSAHSSSAGAAACIVENSNTLKRYYLTTSFGQSTNNQAEVFASLIGYAFIKTLEPTPWNARIKVVSDSEYTLHSSVQYVQKWKRSGKLYGPLVPLKNRYFWQLFDKLTENTDLFGQHVKGHDGHFDNERCDNAAGWGRTRRLEVGPEDGFLVELIKRKRKVETFNDNWFYYDTGDIFDKLNIDDPTLAPDIASVIKELMDCTTEYRDNGDLTLLTTQDRAFRSIIDKIKEAINMANKYRKSDDRILELESKLLDIILEYRDEHY